MADDAALAEARAEVERLRTEVGDLTLRLAFERERTERLRRGIDRSLDAILNAIDAHNDTEL